jgi:hypothetical protein
MVAVVVVVVVVGVVGIVEVGLEAMNYRQYYDFPLLSWDEVTP